VAIAVVQVVPFTETTAATTLTGTATGVTAGHGIALFIGGRSSTQTVSGVSDTLNTYTQVSGFNHNQGSSINLDLWICKSVATGGTLNFTITFSGSCTGMAGLVEMSGQDTVSFIDQAPAAIGSTTSTTVGPSSTTGSTTQANEIVVGCGQFNSGSQTLSAQTFAGSGTVSGQTNQAIITSSVSGAICNLGLSYATTGLVSTTYNFQETISTTSVWNCGIATFLSATAATAYPLRPFTRLQAVNRAGTY
jgi:hypothetical protein